MLTRYVVKHYARSREGELLQVITIYEDQLNKESIKQLNGYTKNWGTLIQRNSAMEWRKELCL
jgi:hypothetical protein